MAKLTPVILDEEPNEMGAWNVKIRVGHKSKSAYIGTDQYITKRDLTKDKGIKPAFIVSNLSGILNKYNEKLKTHKSTILNLTHLELKDLLEKDDEEKAEQEVMFLAFCKEYIDGITVDGTARTLRMAYYRLKDYLKGKDISAKHITSAFLRQYEDYLRQPTTVMRSRGGVLEPLDLKAGNNTTIHGHMNRIRMLHNFAKDRYNDEEVGISLIPNSPFKKFKIVNANEIKDRDFTIEQIIQIRDCKLRPRSRAEFARDMFMLSFYLCGMNAADLHKLPLGDVERVEYYRKKTMNRRADKAFISIKLIDEAKELYVKYAGRIQLKYIKEADLNYAIGRGMKALRDILGEGFEYLDFYSARHSFATIAVNDCGFSLDQVGEALNHKSGKNKVTRGYVRRSWAIIDKIQATVANTIKPILV